jgi:hypothetical protein
MLKIVVKAGLLAATMCMSAVSAEDDLVLGFRGKSKYQVVIPDQMANAAVSNSVAMAAGLLTNAFAANAIAMEVRRESQIDETRPGIYLGPTKFAAANGVDVGKLSGWTYVHKVVGANVIIAGNDQPDTHVGKRIYTPKDKAFPSLVTLLGTTEFAYRYAGARFLSFFPGDIGTEFLPASIIHVPRALNTEGSPFFSERSGAWYWPALYAIASHCYAFDRYCSSGGHLHPRAIPIECKKSHPEYFILANGVRQPESYQLCFSNPEVRELIYKYILATLDEGYDVLQVNQNDGFQPCQCENCAVLYGQKPTAHPADGRAYYDDPAWGEQIWIMHRDMALRLLKDRPGKKLSMLSYGPTRNPPRTFSAFPANTMIEMTRTSEKDFDAWKDVKVPGGFNAYLYNWGTYQLWTPLNTVSKIAEQNRLLVAHNARIIFLDSPPRIGWGLEGPNIYVFMRLGIDPDGKTAYQLFDEYLQAAFRETENPMRRFFTTLQKRVGVRVNSPGFREAGEYPFFELGALYTPDLINSLEEDLTMAEKTAVLPRVKKRLEIVRYEFDYLKHIALVISSYRNYQAMNDAHSLNQLLDAVDARNQFIARVVNGDGKYAKGKNPAYGAIGERDLKYSGEQRLFLDRAPFNWDTAKLRAAPASLLQQGKESLEVTMAESTPTLESPAWDKAVAQKLVSVNVAVTNLQAATSFKALYDRKNLYIRVSGDQPADKMNFVKRGRDAELWLQESIVVNVSPIADKSRYYYLAYEPEPNSFNDAAHGFITDPLHPRIGWNDENWNGQWTFETRLIPDKNRWESMAVIPFETVKASPPKPGEVWCLNVGRVHFLGTEKKKDDRELSAWTGTLNPSYVPGDGSFGKMIFK